MSTNSKLKDFIKLVGEEMPGLEATILFYDGQYEDIDHKTDKIIQEIVMENFIEYISDDLSVEKKE